MTDSQVRGIGLGIPRKEAWDKVTGAVKYLDDIKPPGVLEAWLVVSPHAHARIKSVDVARALACPGVMAVVTGEATGNVLFGSEVADRPPLAREKVRHSGEPVAVVVARSLHEAKLAAGEVKVEYEALEPVNSLERALSGGGPLVHERAHTYKRQTPSSVTPIKDTNIAGHIKVRKGDMKRGWAESEVTVEGRYGLPQSAHAFMEPRVARVEIKPDGRVFVESSTQGPFFVQKMLSKHFGLDQSRVIVKAPLVGGAFGGKTPCYLEPIAYLASRAVGGRAVNLAFTREQDATTGPVHLGVEAHVKLGASRDGRLRAAEYTFWADIGAYTDTGPRMARAMAAACTGPYDIPNVRADSYAVYTNHPFATAYRGFGHLEYAFAMERAMDKLAFALGIDPLELREINAARPGSTSPTQTALTPSRVGDLSRCIQRLREMVGWQGSPRVDLGNGLVRATGVACFWKTSSSPPDATASAILLMNGDGSLTLNVGAVELGQGSKTALAQLVAERLRWDVDKVNVFMEVDTQVSPTFWKTVASKTMYMVGNAALEATEDLIRKLKAIGAVVLRCPHASLEVGGGKIYLREDPGLVVDFMAVAEGYKYPEGNAVGGQILGEGSFIMRHLTPMDPETGKGRVGPAWTVGAQAVEVEYDPETFSYRLLRAASVIDVGKVINPMLARGVVMGGMSMGLGYASREAFAYDRAATVENMQFRTYHLLRFGEQPQYLVDFLETPEIDAPYGLRGVGEHGIVGMPAALANALSVAAEVELDRTPLSPEYIWRCKAAEAARAGKAAPPHRLPGRRRPAASGEAGRPASGLAAAGPGEESRPR